MITDPEVYCLFNFQVLERSYLLGGLEHGFCFSKYIGNFTIPTDELHHFSEGVYTYTTNQTLQSSVLYYPILSNIIIQLLITINHH